MADPFPTFDILPACPTDHHYYPYAPARATSEIHRKMTQEWKLLESHLPDSIHVRVYEDRITLFRAVIVGAAVTPYHDGLFFFDISFTCDDPLYPPRVHYRSFGLEINPDLYFDGFVRLSQIHNRTGETWDQTTVLEILLSIQALILNERPYFNECIFERKRGRKKWERFADSYNENVFCLSCRTMLYVTWKPPAGFEPLVIGHFLERGRRVLLAARAYVSGGARVGYYSSTEVNVSSRGRRGASEKFRRDMVELYPHMVASFRSHGVAIDDLLELGVVDEPLSKENVVKENVVTNIKKAWSKLKLILDLDPVLSYVC